MPVNTLYILVVITILAVLIVLMIGLGGFMGGGEFNRKYGNRLMRWRVILQGVAVILILILVALRGTTGS
ncbi:MAG: twin transmembrane helix small protein [Rhodobacteraceae bacterium]|nr:twin transmembrane helix small protein [Paracoccaceae bacterium]